MEDVFSFRNRESISLLFYIVFIKKYLVFDERQPLQSFIRCSFTFLSSIIRNTFEYIGYLESGFVYFPLRFVHRGDQTWSKRD